MIGLSIVYTYNADTQCNANIVEHRNKQTQQVMGGWVLRSFV